MLTTSALRTICLMILTAFAFNHGVLADDQAASWSAIEISPNQLDIASPESSDQFLVTAIDSLGRRIDVTRSATLSLTNANVAAVSGTGRIDPLSEGEATLTARYSELSATASIRVHGISRPTPVSFRHDVIPILSKSGCNSGGCHGKAEGQNGFRLSVFGFDPGHDFDAIVRDSHARRVFPAAPEQSLLIRKAVASVPHGGGRRIELGSRWHRMLIRWVSEGLSLDDESGDPIVAIRTEPADIVLSRQGTQQLRVVALCQSGAVRGITSEADFQSNNDVVAAVSREGLIQATNVPGEAAVLVRYMGHVAVSRVTLPGPEINFTRPASNSFVDDLVWDKLQKLQIQPSELANDAMFLRRAFLDTIGTLPTPAEVRSFIADTDPDKRRKLVDRLLERPEYSEYWAQRWADLLQADKDIITPQGTVAMTRWIHQQIQANTPWDRLVHNVLTAQGSTVGNSPAGFFQVQADPEKAARAVSQLFLGIRIECAQCHHHPFERWDQKDYFALAGFFTGVDRKSLPGGALKIVDKPGEDLKHPRTGELVPAAGLGAAPATFPEPKDRRRVLAQWLTSSDNHQFARSLVNRLVAHYWGRGLVEPVDDLRATNPASNEPLMQALTQHVIDLRFDMKALTKTLLNSRVYQLDSTINDSNRLDEQNYSRAAVKPMPAEVLLDAISQATGIPERFNGWPEGYRAIQVWDNKLPSLFLETFGRPVRQSVCACERGVEPSMAQALHLMNSETTTAKIEDRRGRAASLAASELPPNVLIEELYLATVSRFPVAQEQELMQQSLTNTDDRRKAVEDILWTLLNTREFVFNH
ncbi:MAG: DUF1549 and DUF1553 domain-containing protein [Planctomycetaceae bacterium]